jgi:hypothetical protein
MLSNKMLRKIMQHSFFCLSFKVYFDVYFSKINSRFALISQAMKKEAETKKKAWFIEGTVELY